jgi:hypothetical protein
VVCRITDATATPIYTSLWQAIPDTVVAAPTILGNVTIGGAGSVTASAYTLAAAGARITAVGSLSVDARNYAPTGAQIDGRGGQTNYVRNPRAEGAVLGVIGSGGAYPTYWFPSDNPAQPGVTRQIVATGVDARTGFAYVDVRVSGTAVAGNAFLHVEPTYWPIVAAGDTFTTTAWLALVGGSLANIPPGTFYYVSNFDVGNNPVVIGTLLNATLTAYGSTAAAPTGATMVSGGFLAWNYPASGAVDFTIRIAACQLERGSVRTPLILPPVGVPGTTSRGLLAMPRVPGLAQAARCVPVSRRSRALAASARHSPSWHCRCWRFPARAARPTSSPTRAPKARFLARLGRGLSGGSRVCAPQA